MGQGCVWRERLEVLEGEEGGHGGGGAGAAEASQQCLGMAQQQPTQARQQLALEKHEEGRQVERRLGWWGGGEG